MGRGQRLPTLALGSENLPTFHVQFSSRPQKEPCFLPIKSMKTDGADVKLVKRVYIDNVI